MNYPSPCERCEKKNCRKLDCPEYIKFINAWWKHFNAVYRKLCCYTHDTNPEKFVYHHPDVYRRYIQNGPCPSCKAVEKCQTPCATYWKWWDDRQEWHKRKVEK